MDNITATLKVIRNLNGRLNELRPFLDHLVVKKVATLSNNCIVVDSALLPKGIQSRELLQFEGLQKLSQFQGFSHVIYDFNEESSFEKESNPS